jgi:catechol 2,3-dioxygenase-like lactoylglutathione lyase family enzyme
MDKRLVMLRLEHLDLLSARAGRGTENRMRPAVHLPIALAFNTQETPMSDIDHISLNVTDYERSKSFYQRALEPLGIKLIMEGGSGAGFGRSFPHFWIRQGVGTFQKAEHVQPITPAHVCFSAKSRAEIEAFHAAALRAGGRDFGAPGLRPQYHPGYFGAFVLDPDGHNIEAVIHGG